MGFDMKALEMITYRIILKKNLTDISKSHQPENNFNKTSSSCILIVMSLLAYLYAVFMET